MYEYDFDEPYYEQTVADEIFEEAKEKLEEALKDEIKSKIEYLSSRAKSLSEKEKRLNEKESKIRQREREVERKEQDSKRDFNRGKFSELFEPLLESCWELSSKSTKKTKCNKCNEDRYRVYKDGDDEIKQKCKCDNQVSVYYPIERKFVDVSKIFISKDKYKSDSLRMSVNFNRKERDDEEYCSLGTDSKKILEIFDEEKQPNRTWEKLYSTKEEAQKHCDYLNKKNGVFKQSRNMDFNQKK